MKSLRNFLFQLIVITTHQVCKCNMFDSFIAYRHGSNAINEDPARYPTLAAPNVSKSVKKIYGYFASSAQSEDFINIVHCYSMSNGLYGATEEVRILWSVVDFSEPNYQQDGISFNIHAVSIPIEREISQFAVHEGDLSAFLVSFK